MTEFLTKFQDAAFLFSPVFLCGAGFLFVWLGLCLWLGGLRWIRVLGGFSGAGLGAFVSSFLNLQQFHWLIGIAIIGGMVGILMGKYTVVLLSGALAALIVNLLLLMPVIQKPETWHDSPKLETLKQGEIIGLNETVTHLEKCCSFMIRTLTEAIRKLGSTGLWFAIVASLVTIGIGLAFPGMVCAMTCSILGTSAIAIGIFFLVLYKGAKPLEYIIDKPGVSYIVVFAMIVFGMLIDMALCPPEKRKVVSTSDKGEKK